MIRRSAWFLIPLLLSVSSGETGERLAVLEFFGRQTCSICSSAGPALTTLQHEFEGRAVILEYDYDNFLYGRQDRFWAAAGSATTLPLVMVGSGYYVSSGRVPFESAYRSMIEIELRRIPHAEISGYWRQNETAIRAYVEVRNPRLPGFEISRYSEVWLIGYEENSDVGHSTTWVRTTEHQPLPYDLDYRGSATLIINSPPVSGADWTSMAGLLLVEEPIGIVSGGFDMLEAAQALPADLYAEPAQFVVAPGDHSVTIQLSGPHVLSWSAVSDVPWIEVSPGSGSVPATATLTVREDIRPHTQTRGLVTFAANGDGMTFDTPVTVDVGSPVRRSGRRVKPAG